MARARTHYLCRACGGVQSRWMGKCPDCGAWDALERFTEPAPAAETGRDDLAAAWIEREEPGRRGVGPVALATPLTEVETAEVARLPTGLGELDRVLGGGFVPGSVVLLGGDPGIGKSTLLLQAAASLARAGRRVLYVSSEESAYQTRLRAERLFAAPPAAPHTDPVPPASGETGPGAVSLGGLDDLFVLADTNLARIVEQARSIRPDVCVLDSIQMVFSPAAEASTGSVPQLRRCASELVALAKVSGMAIALVGHVTKDGQLAGPRLLEHLVDVVLSFEGDRHHAHRIVRGTKNRFGTTLEVGLFEMTAGGLAEVRDPSVLADPAETPPPGSAVCPVVHGTRCLLVEVQALTAAGFPGSAKRRVSGLDANRLAMLIAVLEQHGGLRLADQDVFASAVGGLRITEPAADLAVCLAVAGARTRRGLPPGVGAVGEVGLGGEVRPVPRTEQRRREAARLGYRRLVVPRGQADDPGPDGSTIAVGSISDALDLLQPPPAPTGSADRPGHKKIGTDAGSR